MYVCYWRKIPDWSNDNRMMWINKPFPSAFDSIWMVPKPPGDWDCQMFWEEKNRLAEYHAKKRKRAFVEQFCCNNYVEFCQGRNFSIEDLIRKGSLIYEKINDEFERTE